jgi:hypothetical protein
MSEKNLSYIKPLIQDGTIRVFGDILKHATVTEVAEAMECSPKHVKYVQENPEKIRLGELIKLSEAIGIGWWKVSDLFVG